MSAGNNLLQLSDLFDQEREADRPVAPGIANEADVDLVLVGAGDGLDHTAVPEGRQADMLTSNATD